MKKILFVCVCSLALFSTSAEALRFGSAPVVKVEMRKLTKFLPSYNEALEKALAVHNLMTELPGLQMAAEQQDKLEKESDKMQKYFDNLLKCNEQRFGRFKNGKEILKKVREAYHDRTKKLKEEEGAQAKGSILPLSIAEKNNLADRKKDIEEELMVDALTNTRKWGGKVANKRQVVDPEDMKEKLKGTGLEELDMAEMGVHNMNIARSDMQNTFQQMQQEFIKQMASVGVNYPDFDAARPGDVRKVQKTLKDLKTQYLEEAKEYVAKLDAQDAAHPRAVARRNARTQNQKAVFSKVEEQFPEAYAEMEKIRVSTPQQQQQSLIVAMEKDVNGLVYLSETNALEIDQRIAEAKADEAMLENLQEQADSMITDMQAKYPQQEFDFDLCL